MPTVLLPILPGTLVPNACFNSEQARLNAFAEAMKAELPGQAFYNYGDTVPDISNNAYPWLRTTDGRWYYFSGSWISPVGPEYNVNVRRLWVGNLTSLETYDGGDTNAPSDRSGPMWEEDEDFKGRSPMHPGAISGSDPAKTLGINENYGAGSHTNLVSEMPEHQHAIKYDLSQTGAGYPTIVGNGASNSLSYNTEPVGAAAPTPVNMVHPVRGIYIIKWTGRAFRKV